MPVLHSSVDTGSEVYRRNRQVQLGAVSLQGLCQPITGDFEGWAAVCGGRIKAVASGLRIGGDGECSDTERCDLDREPTEFHIHKSPGW